jgi:hypothetical protein
MQRDSFTGKLLETPIVYLINQEHPKTSTPTSHKHQTEKK